MSNILNNTTSLQEVLEALQNKATPSGGIDTSDATATANDVLANKTAYVKGGKITGMIPTNSESNLTASGSVVTVPAGYYASQTTKSVATTTQATPTISVNSNGVITASATQTAGYVSAGTKSGTKQLTTKAAATITPTKSSQTAVAKNVYTTGEITVAAIPNEYITTSDATATENEIFNGTSAYVNGSKLNGKFTIENELTEQEDLISQISTLVATKANPQGGTDTNDATATAGDLLSGKTAYVKGEKITGNIETKTSSNLTANGATVTVPVGYYASQATKSVATATQATPSISIDANGKITASATQSAGYVSAGTKSGTKQLTTKAAATITPGTSNQTIASGTYLTGTQTIKGDANLKAENIKSGVSIFGVAGTHSGGSSGGNLQTCTVTITSHDISGDLLFPHLDCSYVNEQGEFIMNPPFPQFETSYNIKVVKNSPLMIFGDYSRLEGEGSYSFDIDTVRFSNAYEYYDIIFISEDTNIVLYF